MSRIVYKWRVTTYDGAELGYVYSPDEDHAVADAFMTYGTSRVVVEKVRK